MFSMAFRKRQSLGGTSQRDIEIIRQRLKVARRLAGKEGV